MNELKPCPFCGYPAVFEPFKERKGYAATIRCCNCPADITTITYDTEKEAEMQAVFAWNRRANEDAPTVDVVERKKGKWIKKMRIIETDKYASFTPEWYCSCCGEGYAPYIAELISFCPNCGADMREEKNRWMM